MPLDTRQHGTLHCIATYYSTWLDLTSHHSTLNSILTSHSMQSRLLFATSQMDVLSLIRESLDNWRTRQYDWYQQRSNNILL